MKVIFLDFDGVLCNLESITTRNKRTAANQDPYGPHKDCVAACNRIIKETGAHIVVSSSWRQVVKPEASTERLRRWGIKGYVIGVTPRLDSIRGEEIRHWIEFCADRPVESFVILDDDSDMGQLRHRLVQTNSHAGLTEADADRAIAILNAPPTDMLLARMIQEVRNA